MKRIMLIALILMTAIGFALKGPITVASKIDTEGALLGQMIVIVLQKNGFEVNDKTEFGTTSVIRKAIIAGEIDIYPEYTGNGGFFFDNTDPGIWKNAQQGFETVKRLDFENNGLVWLTPAPANNTWALAIRKDLSDSEGIKTLEDLASYLNRGGFIKLAASEEFLTRPDAMPAFQEAYGFELSNEQLLAFSGGNTAQTIRAASQNIDGVNLAMAYGTDGALSALKLVVLEDTKGVQPVYEPAPIVRKEIHEAYPEIEELLKPVFEALDLETLQMLNASIAIEGLDAGYVAEQFLISKSLID
ncbi:osmoprotectant uptake system substrate-binding protein [Mesotoga sp. Brook.08.105.5.1]|jgi:osmoprotectant transport system substrate-binding protein|uniref:glycine betaine ABC transporter substrate-binding protein OsmF n=1 Tax=unclassified Mesotoga TaxID=1184398 RepID=UPI000AFB053C|nr:MULTISPECIES: ABC transporter substrate-binding protein [unclassified Mesotoga]MDD3460515.1 ABC transporter substrate-binding protein [Mesotoga sp.]RAM58248.1 osmoprotectant uptake system substrate-binding protein [Mesotoga sp. SC_4PWL113PWK15]HNR80518.1 ABC transporter substrate-binding protein [Mesotoga infera]PVD18088.1 osmoprotectant uptake system substrate-binding protein [Mesotoga sp. Brook.08.105.5.1]RAO95582.1 osmoprotectant uptake system substrate-binding protein [Mesotoga sp. Broo